MGTVKKCATLVTGAVILAGALFLAYIEIRSNMPGRVARVRIEMDATEVFNAEMLESAVGFVLENFADTRDGWNELLELRFIESASHRHADIRGADPGSVVVLSARYQRTRINEPPIERFWDWALMREHADADWVVVARGKIL